eukprot:scaffold2311_cov107-Cylindrotheca_fusiformis.AAC.6
MASSNNNSESSSCKKVNHIQASANQIWSSITMARAEKQIPKGVQGTAESMLRVMFGACTSGSPTMEDDFEELSPSVSRERSQSTCDPSDPDTLYPKKYSEKQVISAVEHLQEMRLTSSFQRTTSASKVPGLFPASSPEQKALPAKGSPMLENVTSHGTSFDDGVSAISAHTLEEMALAYEAMDGFPRIRSDLTQDPKLIIEESWKQTVTSRGGNIREPGMSPLRMRRGGRSNLSRYSAQTKSTTSTQTQDFASVFRKDEERYWNDIVKEQDASTSSRSRRAPVQQPGDFLKLNRDGTIATVPSSSCSGTQTPSRSRRHSPRDNDRLLDVLVMPPGTEMAEI